MRFGISTHLYHQERLSVTHLRELAEFGFTEVELFASLGHFDYRAAAAHRELADWLRDAGLALHSVHAPIVEYVRGGEWGSPLSLAHPDETARARAVAETLAALELARTVRFAYLVAHLGVPDQDGSEALNSAAAASRSLREIGPVARDLGVRLALEIIPNTLSSPEALARVVEDEEAGDPTCRPGICLDTGHAFLQGDLPDAIDTVSGELVTTHVHDNRGTADDHLVPFEGHIDWPTAVMTLQKVGYEGVYLLELANTGTAREVLQKTVDARRRLADILA